MIPQLSRKERAEHLYRVITSERFLTKQGLGNEVPFFICPFPAKEGVTMIEDRRDLIERAYALRDLVHATRVAAAHVALHSGAADKFAASVTRDRR